MRTFHVGCKIENHIDLAAVGSLIRPSACARQTGRPQAESNVARHTFTVLLLSALQRFLLTPFLLL